MKYASENVAKRFSIEYVGLNFHDDFDFTQLVGHHAQCRRLIGDMRVRMTLPHSEIKNIHKEQLFTDHLISLGYEIEYEDEPSHSEETA